VNQSTGAKVTARADNSLTKALDEGRSALGLGLRQMGGGEIARIALDCGYDWLFIDLEHGPMSFRTVSQIMLAALEAGIAPVVRVGGHEAFHANRVLTNGAVGVIFPHVDTAEQAAACAATCRFAPRGIRGVPAFFPQMGYVKPSLKDAVPYLNDLTKVIVMIESAEAVGNVDAIAATEGVDVLFVGASDLTVELGVPGQYRDPRVLASLDRIAEACARHGKVAGIGGIADRALLGELVAKGFRFILAGNDLDIFMPAAKARANELRDLG
jgi:2-keto-3-deoxy-L-rhamnonate aldolase RhmA